MFSDSLRDLESGHNLYLRRVFEIRKQQAAAGGNDKNQIYTPERTISIGINLFILRTGSSFNVQLARNLQHHV